MCKNISESNYLDSIHQLGMDSGSQPVLPASVFTTDPLEGGAPLVRHGWFARLLMTGQPLSDREIKGAGYRVIQSWARTAHPCPVGGTRGL